MRRVKRILSILLIMIILIPSTSIAAAAGFRYEAEALILNKLGLFAGVSTTRFDPDLGSQLQRQSAVILLVKDHDYNGYVAKSRDEFVAFAVNQFKKGVNPITVKVSDSDKPGFDLAEALLSIQKATGAKLRMRGADTYGIVDLLY